MCHTHSLNISYTVNRQESLHQFVQRTDISNETNEYEQLTLLDCTCTETCIIHNTDTEISHEICEYEQSTVLDCIETCIPVIHDTETTISYAIIEYDQFTVLDSAETYINHNDYDDDTISMSTSMRKKCMLNCPLRAHNHMLNKGLRGKGMHLGHLIVRCLRSQFEPT